MPSSISAGPGRWFLLTLLSRSQSATPADHRRHEEAVYLVRARDQDDALEKAHQLGVASEHAYRNDDGEPVSWFYVGPVAVELLDEQDLDDGVEVWSRWTREPPALLPGFEERPLEEALAAQELRRMKDVDE